MIEYSKQYLANGFCSKVVIMRLLPRSNQWYMERMRQFSSALTTHTNSSIVGWYWCKPVRWHYVIITWWCPSDRWRLQKSCEVPRLSDIPFSSTRCKIQEMLEIWMFILIAELISQWNGCCGSTLWLPKQQLRLQFRQLQFESQLQFSCSCSS